MNKHKFLNNGKNKNLKIQLSIDTDNTGSEDEIKSYLDLKNINQYNPKIDQEVVRLKSVIDSAYYSLNWYFDFSAYESDKLGPVPTVDEIFELRAQIKKNIRNSFIMYTLFDSTNSNDQNLLHTGYYTTNNNIDIFDLYDTVYLDTNNDVIQIRIPLDNKEGTAWYIPTNNFTGITDNSFIYGRFSFFDIDSGDYIFFEKNGNKTQESNMYVEFIVSDPNNKTFDSNEFNEEPSIFENFGDNKLSLYSIDDNDEYTDNLVRNQSTFANQKPTYPTGDTFQETGEYD